MRASDTKPLKRIVRNSHPSDRRIPEFTVLIGANELTIRPLKSKGGGEREIIVPWVAIYEHFIYQRYLRSLPPVQPKRRKRVTRGAL